MTRADEWSRVDYRSRAAAAICAITTTLVAAVTVTAYVGTRIGFADRRAGGLVVRLDRGRVLLRPTASAAATTLY